MFPLFLPRAPIRRSSHCWADAGRCWKTPQKRQEALQEISGTTLKQVLMSLMQPWLGLHKEQKCLKKVEMTSDNPLCRNISNGQQEWAYYKVVVPLDQLRAVNPSANPRNPSDKYIKIVTMSNHKFWFMGFISYEKALKNLREALQFLLRAFSPMQPLVSARSLSTHLIRIYLHFGQSSMTLQNL